MDKGTSITEVKTFNALVEDYWALHPFQYALGRTIATGRWALKGFSWLFMMISILAGPTMTLSVGYIIFYAIEFKHSLSYIAIHPSLLDNIATFSSNVINVAPELVFPGVVVLAIKAFTGKRWIDGVLYSLVSIAFISLTMTLLHAYMSNSITESFLQVMLFWRAFSSLAYTVVVEYCGHHDTNIHAALKMLEQVRSTVDELTGERDEIRSTLETVSRERDGLRSTVDGLRSTLETVSRERDGLRSTVDGLRSTVDGLRSTVDGLQETLEQSQDARALLETVSRERDEGRELLEVTTREYQDARALLETVSRERDGLRSTLKAVSRERDGLRSTVDGLRSTGTKKSTGTHDGLQSTGTKKSTGTHDGLRSTGTSSDETKKYTGTSSDETKKLIKQTMLILEDEGTTITYPIVATRAGLSLATVKKYGSTIRQELAARPGTRAGRLSLVPEQDNQDEPITDTLVAIGD